MEFFYGHPHDWYVLGWHISVLLSMWLAWHVAARYYRGKDQ